MYLHTYNGRPSYLRSHQRRTLMAKDKVREERRQRGRGRGRGRDRERRQERTSQLGPAREDLKMGFAGFKMMWSLLGVAAVSWLAAMGRLPHDTNHTSGIAAYMQVRRFVDICSRNAYATRCPPGAAIMLFTETMLAGACSPVGCFYLDTSPGAVVLEVS